MCCQKITAFLCFLYLWFKSTHSRLYTGYFSSKKWFWQHHVFEDEWLWSLNTHIECPALQLVPSVVCSNAGKLVPDARNSNRNIHGRQEADHTNNFQYSMISGTKFRQEIMLVTTARICIGTTVHRSRRIFFWHAQFTITLGCPNVQDHKETPCVAPTNLYVGRTHLVFTTFWLEMLRIHLHNPLLLLREKLKIKSK